MSLNFEGIFTKDLQLLAYNDYKNKKKVLYPISINPCVMK